MEKSQGNTLYDCLGKEWRVGEKIGTGGFGTVYKASDEASDKASEYPNKNLKFAVKIEPLKNRTLRRKIFFYSMYTKKEDLKNFALTRGWSTVGIPSFIGSGRFKTGSDQFRFLVMPRFSVNLRKLFVDSHQRFKLHTVYHLGWQKINALEYLHSFQCVHTDIKSSNILLKASALEQAFLVDFGLICRIPTDFKPVQNKKHIGTTIYASRDSHNGVPTMRGDIEILTYNLIKWAGGKLPWTEENFKGKLDETQKAKEFFIKQDNPLEICFGKKEIPTKLNSLMAYVGSIQIEMKPDYEKIRTILEDGINELGKKNSGELDFGHAGRNK